MTRHLAPFSPSHPDFSQRLPSWPLKHIWMLYTSPRFTHGGPPSEFFLRIKTTGESCSAWLPPWVFDLSFNLCLKGQKASILVPVFLGAVSASVGAWARAVCRCFIRAGPAPATKKELFFPQEKSGSANQPSRSFGQFEGSKQGSPFSLIISIFYHVARSWGVPEGIRG